MDIINNLLEGKVAFGKKEVLTDRLTLIPVYKIKANFINIENDIKSNKIEGNNQSVSVTPICIVKVYDEDVSVITLDGKKDSVDFFDILPSIISNVDINQIVKGFKS